MLRFGRRCFLEAEGVDLACTMLAWIMAWIHGEAWGRLEGLVFSRAVSQSCEYDTCLRGTDHGPMVGHWVGWEEPLPRAERAAAQQRDYSVWSRGAHVGSHQSHWQPVLRRPTKRSVCCQSGD